MFHCELLRFLDHAKTVYPTSAWHSSQSKFTERLFQSLQPNFFQLFYAPSDYFVYLMSSNCNLRGQPDSLIHPFLTFLSCSFEIKLSYVHK